jgi:hypothetical protein
MTATVINLLVDDANVSFELADGRVVSAPIAWYPRLMHGTPAERNEWRLIAGGRGIHWPTLEEDISVDNLLNGQPSGESQSSLKKWLEQRAR